MILSVRLSSYHIRLFVQMFFEKQVPLQSI